MELTFNKGQFLKGLYLAQGIVDRKSSNPILANTLLRSEGSESITCSATDLRNSMVAEIPAQVAGEGAICLAAKPLYDIVKNLSGEQITLKRADNNWAEISGGKAHYRLIGLPDRDFPRLVDHREVSFTELDSAVFAEMISKTIFSVSTDETRLHLSGIFFECDGQQARMVSTDGHRLSKVERDLGSGPTLDKGVIIPRKGVIELRRLLEGASGACEIGFAHGHVFVRSSDVVLSVALIDAQFPPYGQVIPQENDKQLRLAKGPFLESLKRVAIMSSEPSWGIRMDLSKGRLRIKSDNPDLGQAEEDIDVEYAGPELVVGFNARYFIDVVNEVNSDAVVLELNGELDPGLIHADGAMDYVGVVMPMRI